MKILILEVKAAMWVNTQSYITKKVNHEAILTDFNDWASPESKEIKIVTNWS